MTNSSDKKSGSREIPGFFLAKRVAQLLGVILVLSFSGCDDDEPEKEKVLVESTKFLDRSASELRTFLATSSFDFTNEIQYDVDLYRVTYKTTYKDQEVIASGVVILPKTNVGVEMISFQHGTISAQSQAPTKLPINSTELILYSALASTGLVVVVPDFIGFGESSEIFHPYYVEETTAQAVLDNVRAAADLAKLRSVNFNSELFLAGYSQGGYATMAAHKAIESDGMEGFNLIASFPASGGYDVKEMQEYFFKQTNYNEPFYIAYVALAYQGYYGWSNPLSDFFQEPYATKIPSLFNGVLTGGQINLQLTTTIPSLITPLALSSIDTDARFSPIVNAFNENSLTDWTPRVPMYMYHGNKDITVPYENSVSVYNQLLANGASASTLKFSTLENADHGSGIIPYVEQFVPILLDLK
jgi:pimeloyl-ACP methyl ester carboxylesterase